ncbi:MAG: NUDIX hydrolase [Chloroflexi bacterium]|nr:NUDIX hydrolase [Chloroflexota bacterium]
MELWKTKSRQQVLSFGKWLTLETHEVQLPDGAVIPDWYWLDSPDYVNVLALTGEGKVLIFRQVKYGVDGETLATVGGYLEPGEQPLAGAKRELLEETGYEAARWIDLGQYRVDPNHGAGMGTLFLALGARKTTERNADDLEEQVLMEMDIEAVEQALMEGRFKAVAWSANVALGLLYLKRDGGVK